MCKLVALFLAALAFLFSMPQARAGDEPAIQGDEAALSYLRKVHDQVHPLWAGTFLSLAASQLPKDHPINVPSRRVELEVVLFAKGALADVQVAKSSGATEFDASAVDMLRRAGTFPPAPEALLSDDGKAHLLWAFARDDRRCSGLGVTHRELPLADAVRSLVRREQDDAAVSRLQSATDDERPAGMDAFARAWLYRMENEKDLALEIAAQNALAGDARGADVLRNAVDLADTGARDEDAARGLAALGIPICPLIRASLAKEPKAVKGTVAASSTDLSDEQFANRLRSKQIRPRVLNLIAYGTSDACLSFAIAIAKDRSTPGIERAFAITCLEHTDVPEAKAALRALTKDPDLQIRYMAIRAEARPGAGRGAVFRLTPLLRDKSLLVRTAAATALVRVGGEDVLSQLFLVYKEKDPAIYLAVADELAQLSGAASAEMLGRFLKKDGPHIRVAAAHALAARHDEHAEKLRASLADSDNAELQLLAGLGLSKDKRDAALRAVAVDGFVASYAALLGGSARIVAADWLLAHFTDLSSHERTKYLGAWLATRPKQL